eukprot:1302060-Pleurochrysis_carterae.AAC.2
MEGNISRTQKMCFVNIHRMPRISCSQCISLGQCATRSATPLSGSLQGKFLRHHFAPLMHHKAINGFPKP